MLSIGDGSPRQHSATPLGDGTPEQQPATPLAAGQGEDGAEQVHGVVGSPLATEEEEEESQFPSTQQLFGADSSYVEMLHVYLTINKSTCHFVEHLTCMLLL